MVVTFALTVVDVGFAAGLVVRVVAGFVVVGFVVGLKVVLGAVAVEVDEFGGRQIDRPGYSGDETVAWLTLNSRVSVTLTFFATPIQKSPATTRYLLSQVGRAVAGVSTKSSLNDTAARRPSSRQTVNPTNG